MKKTRQMISEYINNIQTEIGFLAIAAYAGQAIGWGLSAIDAANKTKEFYTNFLDDAEGKCSDLEGRLKSICKLKIKVPATKALIAGLYKSITRCSKDENPGECRKNITEKIKAEKQKLAMLENQLNIALNQRLRAS
jgi:hypothetical protein